MKLLWPQAQHLYLSPHLDDAVLSCGGMILQQTAAGRSVAVVTVFAGSPLPFRSLSPFALELHHRWQESASQEEFADPPAMRRVEDIRAFARLHPAIHVVHFPFMDCIYRVHPVTGEALYASEEAIFGELDSVDPALEPLEISPPVLDESTLYCPLGIGHHVDHQVVRRVVDGWGFDSSQVRYYEDYPYAGAPGAVEAIVGPNEGWIPSITPLSEADLNAKIDAVGEHNSQIKTFWETREAMAEAVRQFTARTGGERVWIHAGQ